MELHESPEYRDLEQRFREQVVEDRPLVIKEAEKGAGVYLPCVAPTSKVDYIIVGMEPSYGWAGDANIEEAEKMVAEGALNFSPEDSKEPLALFIRSICKYLCQSGETYHLTDVAKGAMPVKVATLDREARFRRWYPLLLKEIAIVGKPDCSIIAIGREVTRFLKKHGVDDHPLYAVPHYSMQAMRHFKEEVGKDPSGFEQFQNTAFHKDDWPEDLSEPMKWLVFVYKKRFEDIQEKVAAANA